MSVDDPSSSSATSPRPRRGSFTSATFSQLFGRPNTSTSPTSTGTAPFPNPINAASGPEQRRRMSLSTIGLSGSMQPAPMAINRRTSVSTAGSESIDENAIDDDDGLSRSTPTSPFSAHRLSFGSQALRAGRAASLSGGSMPAAAALSGTAPPPPPSSSSSSSSLPPRKASVGRRGRDVAAASHPQASTSRSGTASDVSYLRSGEGLNWSEQFRSRAESAVTQRPSAHVLPPTNKHHDRAKSVSEMPGPPNTIPGSSTPPLRKKPDAFGERMLKGDFYMD